MSRMIEADDLREWTYVIIDSPRNPLGDFAPCAPTTSLRYEFEHQLASFRGIPWRVVSVSLPFALLSTRLPSDRYSSPEKSERRSLSIDTRTVVLRACSLDFYLEWLRQFTGLDSALSDFLDTQTCVAVARYGVTTLADLLRVSPDQMRTIQGIGPQRMHRLKNLLRVVGG